MTWTPPINYLHARLVVSAVRIGPTEWSVLFQPAGWSTSSRTRMFGFPIGSSNGSFSAESLPSFDIITTKVIKPITPRRSTIRNLFLTALGSFFLFLSMDLQTTDREQLKYNQLGIGNILFNDALNTFLIRLYGIIQKIFF